MKRYRLIFASLILLGAGTLIGMRTLLPAQAEGTPTPENQIVNPNAGAGQSPAAAESAQTGIKGITDEYVRSFNAGDAKAAASLWTTDGEYFGVDGQTVRGQAAIEKLLAADFKTYPKAHIDIRVETIRSLSRTTALAEAAVKVKYTSTTAVEETRYSALHVFEDGKWRVASVREWVSEPETNADMKLLDWFVGTWTAKGPVGVITLSYSWDESRTYLNGKFTITKDGNTTSTGTQIFRVNPKGGLRVWTFDSNGADCHGLWTREGNRWIDDSKGTRPDGTEVTAINVLIPLGPDSFSWQTPERESNGVSLPPLPPIKVTRVKPTK